jgi:hypothetical protein
MSLILILYAGWLIYLGLSEGNYADRQRRLGEHENALRHYRAALLLNVAALINLSLGILTALYEP